MACSQLRQGTSCAMPPAYEAISDTLPGTDLETPSTYQDRADARCARARSGRAWGSAATLLGAGLLVLTALALAAARGRGPGPRESRSSLTRSAAVEDGAGAGEGVLDVGRQPETGERGALTVLNVHPDFGEVEGAYFGFSAQNADEVFGTSDWSGQVFRMSNGLVAGDVVVWRREQFCHGMSCGRWHPGALAGPGNWSVGDRLVLRPERSVAGLAAMGTTSTGVATPTVDATTERVTAAVSPAPLFEFYMYRANAADAAKRYSFGNINTGNLDGVVWYLMNEVVTLYTDGAQCPRKFNISQINRYRVRTRATKEIFETGMSFGARFSYDFGMCMGRCFPDNKCSGPDDCDYHNRKYGFNVGCNNFLDHYPYPDGDTPTPGGIWYALPLDGRCSGEPTGAKDCTWSYEDAGALSLEEVEAMNPGGPHCCPADRCTGFWENQFDEDATRGRVGAILSAFGQKYPERPPDIGPSQCDFRRDAWYTPETDIWPLRDPWAHEDAEPASGVGDGAQIGTQEWGTQEWHDDST